MFDYQYWKFVYELGGIDIHATRINSNEAINDWFEMMLMGGEL